jgi:hypothetical protein
MGVVGANSASATPPTITAGPGSSVTCSFTAKAAFYEGTGTLGGPAPGAKTALRNDWKASDHSSDPGFNSKTNTSGDAAVKAAVAAVPDTQFADVDPISTLSKGKSVSCSGTVTDGTHTASVTSVKTIGLSVSTMPAGTHATCAGLTSGGTFDSILQWKASGAKVTNTTITGSSLAQLADSHGVGFKLTGGTATGSFAGSTGETDAYLDAATGPAILAGILGPHVSSANAKTIKTLNPCEPGLKIKIPKNPPDIASIKAGKGIKKIGIGPAGVGVAPLSPPAGDGHASTLNLHY